LTRSILPTFDWNSSSIAATAEEKDMALTLWGNPPLFDLTENLTQCREYHREQLCNVSKVGRSLGLTCGG
jgi:hypothetical protein